MKILLILLFFFNYRTLQSIEKNLSSVQFSTPLNSLTTVNCQNNFNMYSGNLFVSNNLLLRGDTLTIGNNQQPTIIVIPNLPEANATDIYLLCMLSLGSNLVYLGDKHSPVPPPDFISIPLLQTNDILIYEPVSENALHTTYFNYLQGGDIFLGNLYCDFCF